jgi:hypothetical protein
MKTEIKTPTTPNFIKVTIGKQEVNLSISEFDEKELREIGERWTNDLIASARKRKENTL